jgi:hypothetical protein
MESLQARAHIAVLKPLVDQQSTSIHETHHTKVGESWLSSPISRNPKPTCCQTGNREIKHAEQRQDFTALEQLTSQIQQHVPRVELSPPRLQPEERLRRSDWHTRAIRNDNIVENEVVSFFRKRKKQKNAFARKLKVERVENVPAGTCLSYLLR